MWDGEGCGMERLGESGMERLGEGGKMGWRGWGKVGRWDGEAEGYDMDLHTSLYMVICNYICLLLVDCYVCLCRRPFRNAVYNNMQA